MADVHHPTRNDDRVSHDPSDVRPVATKEAMRRASLYDVVAGRAGPNGFLSSEQLRSSSSFPSGPEEYLLRRTTIPADLLDETVAREVQQQPSSSSRRRGKLPDSETLRAVHQYASDFYYSIGSDKEKVDTRSLDETALIAVGILLEEAVKEAMGENGDMVFVEPEGLENGLEESKVTTYQIKGRVKPTRRPQIESEDQDSLEEEASPAKRRRY